MRCPFCNGQLVWQSDDNANELSDDYAEDDCAVVSFYVCSCCGRDFEIFDPPKEERETRYREYWEGGYSL